MLQIMVATEDGEIISSSLEKGILAVPSRELVKDILDVRVLLMQNH